MALDKLVDSTQLDSDLTSVANAIRTKGGTSAQLAFPSDFVSAIAAIPTGGSGIQFDLIGTTTIALQEYTDTVNGEETDTQIDISNTDYAWIVTVITCDSAITTTTEWGMTISIGGRYTSNGAYFDGTDIMQKGSATLSKAAMVNNTLGASSYGVRTLNNKNTIQMSRKCHGTACPKCRAGNYTITVYGLKSL